MKKVNAQSKKTVLSFFSAAFNLMLTLALISSAAACAFLLFFRFEEPPSIFGGTAIRILSDSMQPEFYAGDIVIIKKKDALELKENDVIAYFRYSGTGGTVIVFHRIVDVGQTEGGELIFQTKGDRNGNPDKNWVPAKDIIGVYNEKAAIWNKLLSLVSSKHGIIYLVIAPAGLVLISETLVLVNLLSGKTKADDTRTGISSSLV